jgi:xanthosine utilization system XapX-like protein
LLNHTIFGEFAVVGKQSDICKFSKVLPKKMNKKIVRRSTGAWLITAAFALFCIILGISRISKHADGGFLYLSSGVVLGLLSLVQLLITAPRIITDDEGITGILVGNVKIPWKEIRDAELKYVVRGDPVITLLLYNNSKRPMILSGNDTSAEEIYSEITWHLRVHGRDAALHTEESEQWDEEEPEEST